MELSIEKNRKEQKYSRTHQFKRVLWIIGKVFFRLTPRPSFGIRRYILRLFGAKVGRHVHIYPSAIIYFPWNLEIGNWSAIGENVLIYNLGEICIGEKVTISHNAHLCAGTHDYTDVTLPLIKPPIIIGDQAWVCAEAFVGPNLTVGEGSIVGAGTVLTYNTVPWMVYAGNPAVQIKKRELKNDK